MDLEKAIGRLQRIRGDWGGLLDKWRFSRNEREDSMTPLRQLSRWESHTQAGK